MKKPDTETTDDLDAAQREAEREAPSASETASEVAEKSRLHAAVVFEIIQREGSGELARGFPALWWSGVAAGLAIGFSVLSEALLSAHLPDAPWKPLVENFGYCVGFLIVILARQQLFTENTLTAVLPVILRRELGWLLAMLRLWGIVLSANLIGCLLIALFMAHANVVSPEVAAAISKIGLHMMQHEPVDMLLRGVVAGWLIAALVWMLPSAEGNEFLVITLMTYLIALGDFTHVIAGSVEVIYLVAKGEAAIYAALFGFFLPTLVGNVLGGTVLFGLMSYIQVREEIDEVHDASSARAASRAD